MYCKFKEGDLVMVKRDTKSYYGACVRKWIYGTVLKCFAADGRYNGYVRILLSKDNFTLIPIKDLKKISDKKIPKGSYSAPRFNNGDHVLYKGETGLLNIESWVVDNKPYYKERRIVIRTASGKYIFVNECDTQMLNDGRYFDKEVSNILNDGRIIQYKREGNTITATLYDGNSHSPIVSASDKCHPDDRFDIDIGMDIAFTRLVGKWKLINKKSNLQKFKDGEIWVKTDKENFIDFMAICTRRDISWRDASVLEWISNSLVNGDPIYVKVDNDTGRMFYQFFPLDLKPVITVPELTN